MTSISCDIHVSSLRHFKGDVILPPKKTYTLVISYPLSKPYKKQINTGKNGMGLGGLLVEIGKAYNEVYAKDDEYGVWGHDMEDLAIEGISINPKTNTITLSVGS